MKRNIYILEEIITEESVVKAMDKILKKQMTIDNKLSSFIFLAAIYAVINSIHVNEQNKRIEALSKEIEELKQPKGE